MMSVATNASAAPSAAPVAVRKTDQAARMDDLRVIIKPEARDRWISTAVTQYTPDMLENIVRSAMAGYMISQWELYDLMEATWPRLMKNLNELRRAVKHLDWNVQPWALKGQDPTPEAQRRARLFEQAIWQMRPRPEADENDFEGTLGDVLDAWGKGISVMEIDWWLRQSEAGQIMAPRATRWVHPRHYGYSALSADLMLSIRETGINIDALPSAGQAIEGFAPFPPNKFIVSIAKQKSGPPVGGALLRPLAFFWLAANFSQSWLLNFAQIFGMPIRWATYDPSRPGLLDDIIEMLQTMGSASYGAFPAGTTIDLKEATKSGQDNPQAYMIHLADRVCDIAVLGQTLTTEPGVRGTHALGVVHQEIRGDVINGVAEWAAAVLNLQLASAFCVLNFGDDSECPWLAPSAKVIKDSIQMAQRDAILWRMGMRLPEQYMYERHDVPVPAEGENVITPPPPSAHDPQGATGDVPLSQQVKAKDATQKLIDNVLEDLTGVEAKWLGGVRPFFARLVDAAKSGSLSDHELMQSLERAKNQMPELFGSLDHEALAKALSDAMAAGLVNGVVQGVAATPTHRKVFTA